MKESKAKQCRVEICNCKENPELVSEIVLGSWLHVEMMDVGDHHGTTRFFARIGDYEFDVQIKGQGEVSVFSKN